MRSLAAVLMVFALAGCVPPQVLTVKEPDLDKVWFVCATEQPGSTARMERWVVLVDNKIKEPVRVRVWIERRTKSGEIAGFVCDDKTLPPGKNAIELDLRMPEVLGLDKGDAILRVSGTWLGDFGTGLETCELLPRSEIL